MSLKLPLNGLTPCSYNHITILAIYLKFILPYLKQYKKLHFSSVRWTGSVFADLTAKQLGHVLFTVTKCCSATELRAAPCYWHFPCHLRPGEESTIMAILVFTMSKYNKITSPSVVKHASLPSPYLCFYQEFISIFYATWR